MDPVLIAAAVIPAVILLLQVYRADRLEKEPTGLLISLLVFGVIATALAIVTETIGENILLSFFDETDLGYLILSNFIVVALSEEGFKLLLLRWRNSGQYGVDFIVPGMPLELVDNNNVETYARRTVKSVRRLNKVYTEVTFTEPLPDGVEPMHVVAADDERILRAVEEFGGRAVMTSSEHRSGTDRCWEAYGKLGREYDAVINVQGDEPFIRPEQLRAIMRCFDVPGTDIATLVRPFAESDGLAALENPNSPKVVLDGESRAIYFSRSVIPYLRGVERSEWLAKHTFYKHIGMYAFRTKVLAEVTALPPSSLEKAESLEQLRWLENGYRIGVGISDVETIGIDTPEDLAAAEEFLKRMKR